MFVSLLLFYHVVVVRVRGVEMRRNRWAGLDRWGFFSLVHITVWFLAGKRKIIASEHLGDLGAALCCVSWMHENEKKSQGVDIRSIRRKDAFHKRIYITI